MRRLFILLLLLCCTSRLEAGTFTDTFSLPNGSLPALWGNEWGDWRVNGGVYNNGSYSFPPPSHTMLPWTLTNFVVDVDLTQVGDGGVWLRASDAPETYVGTNGVLFVFREYDMYFHILNNTVANDNWWGVGWGYTFHLTGSHHIQIIVSGNSYSASMDGGVVTTSITTPLFSSGQVGLYGYLGFDNFSVTGDGVPIPEPSTMLLLGSGLLALVGLRRWKNMYRSR